MQNNIIIYGAGYLGIMTSRCFIKNKITPTCFVDKNKCGQIIDNIKVIGLQDLCKYDKKDLIIVCIYKKGSLYEDIKNNLQKLGFTNVKHIYELRENNDIMKYQPIPLYASKEYLKEHEKDINMVNSYLTDELSKSTFTSVLDFVSNDFDVPIKSFPITEQYLSYDVYKKISDEVFIDCGAFIGEVLDEFNRKNDGVFKKYIAYEPEIINYTKLSKKICDNYDKEKVISYNLAISDKNETLKFENIAGANAICSDTGNCEVNAITLDEHLQNVAPTFLKVDVEGFEQKLLDGAKKMIGQCKPVIAIAIYHHVEDFWQMPIWIKENFPDYKIYIRSYMNYVETICYAVPPNRII